MTALLYGSTAGARCVRGDRSIPRERGSRLGSRRAGGDLLGQNAFDVAAVRSSSCGVVASICGTEDRRPFLGTAQKRPVRPTRPPARHSPGQLPSGGHVPDQSLVHSVPTPGHRTAEVSRRRAHPVAQGAHRRHRRIWATVLRSSRGDGDDRRRRASRVGGACAPSARPGRPHHYAAVASCGGGEGGDPPDHGDLVRTIRSRVAQLDRVLATRYPGMRSTEEFRDRRLALTP
jgi:hypothetical protein